MAKTKGKPGPKARHDSTRDYHIYLPDKPQEGQSTSLADAFEQAAKRYAEQQREQGIPMYGIGANAFIEMVLLRSPEISEILRRSETGVKTP
jgi:hypothetical protein